MDYSRCPLPDVTFTRLNEHYRPSVRLARLILRNTSISQESGPVRSSAFLVNMNQVFEDFVVVALRDAMGLSARCFPQQCSGRALWLDAEKRIRLKPDLSWWRAGRPVFVGDVKYKRLGAEGARNPDLYQLLAYLIATRLTRGMLVYGESTGPPTIHRVQSDGRQLEVLGLDLNQEPEMVLADLSRLANRIKASVDQPRLTAAGPP